MSVRNGMPYVKKTVPSILGQTFLDFEFVIVDNCSTDGTREYLQSVAAVAPRIRLLLNEHDLGHSGGLNRGLAACQSPDGLWHQLLDRNDTYLETSASAIFVYAIAHGINRGWLGATAHGPMVMIGWNAIAKRVNAKGQVEGTCVGTDMGFEPTFYAYRPTSVFAAHGYGPVLLAGAEMFALRNGAGKDAAVKLGALHMQPGAPLF